MPKQATSRKASSSSRGNPWRRITIKRPQEENFYDCDYQDENNWISTKDVSVDDPKTYKHTASFGLLQSSQGSQEIKVEEGVSHVPSLSTAPGDYQYEGELFFRSNTPIDDVRACVKPVLKDIISDWDNAYSKVRSLDISSYMAENKINFQCNTVLSYQDKPKHIGPTLCEFEISRQRKSESKSSATKEDV